ncbi:hypothetical protein C3E97_027630 [Pseudomonas sp. MWU12-2115]|uniref:hypothetical protein n=1 Tax=unclassified Pseudomonas TaxID=196821 RepID=UPI000DD4F320|nr:hypothetical protein [Pseudomonas sp. MWU12-2020]RBB97492.1 hypothetical protein C3E97_027630 [Pseudomonas sp. MWU12-2115]
MTAIKERPILFSAPMVRAILEGRKTVTRRAMKVQPVLTGKLWQVYGAGWSAGVTSVPVISGHSLSTKCPYGKPGDRLYVRETFNRTNPGGAEGVYYYRADGEFPNSIGGGKFTDAESWKPSIHMPRAASRILLEITDVRVERLQDISRSDIRAEGLQCPPELASDDVSPNYRDWYPAAWKKLWNSTGGDWDANPWVWVVEFKRVQP